MTDVWERYLEKHVRDNKFNQSNIQIDNDLACFLQSFRECHGINDLVLLSDVWLAHHPVFDPVLEVHNM